ncbi:class II aldolase/adducin family protein [Streptomyces malaysiensis]|uniref:class II aldolase/adducin family protein n=1 Tax=Streptomyces TaxID=1883 RepID=UPI001E533665|nr:MULTISPECIES: class II aldolase/adducin family protein [Streptomyces]UHH15524.1 class II aldolase/adducin family protein [Streptomyces sp. HNM0561]
MTTELPDTAVDKARDEIVRVGTSLFNRGYVHASAGNISARVSDGHLITPTDAALGFLDHHRLALVDANGERIAGDRASKTLTLHRRVYAADPTARFVIHTHSTHLVALDRPHHDQLGPGLGGVHVRHRRGDVLRAQVSARCGGGRVLPGCDPVLHREGRGRAGGRR